MFKGHNDLDMLDKVFQLCGTPDDTNFKNFSELARNVQFNVQQKHPRRLREVFSQ
jgi:hypothetical protein